MPTDRFRDSRPFRLRQHLPGAVVLFLIGAFQVMRGAWGDVTIFAAALALLITGAFDRMHSAASIRRPTLTVLSSIAIVLGLALFLAPRHGAAAGIILGAAGLVAVGVAWFGPPGAGGSGAGGSSSGGVVAPGRRPAMTALIAWSATLLVAAGWEATAYLGGRWADVPDGALPAISEVLDPLLDLPVGKAVFLSLWLAAGVALLRRGWLRTGERK